MCRTKKHSKAGSQESKDESLVLTHNKENGGEAGKVDKKYPRREQKNPNRFVVLVQHEEEETKQRESEQASTGETSLEEVEQVVGRLKLGKAPGGDEIAAEYLKFGGNRHKVAVGHHQFKSSVHAKQMKGNYKHTKCYP